MPSHSETLAKIKVNDTMPANPLGFYVLVEVVEVETESSGGIYLGDQGREQSAEEVGYLRAVGPTAYHGWEGCEVEVFKSSFEKGTLPYDEELSDFLHRRRLPYQKWGLQIGDMVEFRAYEGKKSVIPGYERWRYIPDSHIVGRVNRED